MAQKVQVLLVDDLDGGEASETVQFSLDGTAYEVDLSESNAQKMRDSIAQYVGVARKAGRSGGTATARGRGRASSARSAANNTGEIREWARSNGHKISDRGRVPATILDAFEKAHS